MTPEQKVLAWNDEGLLERFYEMAGKHLSDGVRPSLADQRAYLELSRERRKG